MKKLIKYFSPYLISIIFCFIFLFTQALCDLNLPNFMSKIVNVGIQQFGIENDAPDAVSTRAFNLMTKCMSNDDKIYAEERYELLRTNDKDIVNKYAKKYPLLQDEDIYLLTFHNDMESINKCFINASSTLIYLLKDLSSTQLNNSNISTMDFSGFNINDLYLIIPYIDSIEDDKFDSIIQSATSMDDSIKEQVSIIFVKQFYKELKIDIGNMQTFYIIKIGFFMVLLTLISVLATIFVSYLSSKIAASAGKSIRRSIFKQVTSFSNIEFDKFSTASLITRTTNDITQIQFLSITMIRTIGYAFFMGIGGIIMALSRSVSMSWIIALGILILIGIISIIFSIAKPKFKIIQNLVDKLNLVTRENLTGIMVIRAFSNQEFEEKRFDQVNSDLTNINKFVNKVMVLMMPTMMFLMNTISLLIVWVGAHQIEMSNIKVGDMMAFMQYAIQIIMAFLMISVMFVMIPRASVSTARVVEVLETEPAIQDEPHSHKLGQHVKGQLQFKNVSFKYENADENVLTNITFTANPGETTAIIGSTGSGKSTIINLIPRFYDVTSGEILLDNVNIKNISQHDLRENIGYVPQKAILFSGTINFNLKYGNDSITDEEIEKIADVSQSLEFIKLKDLGFDSSISQGGSNVSGGQKQRLSIARALAKKPQIYLFDDSFSALDVKTDKKLRTALKSYTKNATVIIVAQRISTIINADKIIVLNEGKIEAIGTHKKLLKNCKIYKEIAESQLTKEDCNE